MKVLFLGKANDLGTSAALEFLRELFPDTVSRLGDWGDTIDTFLFDDDWHLIVSYLSRWIVPKTALDRAGIAINFHPAPPEYPGIGCVNFALYDRAKTYGATCHHMRPKVDTGPIIRTRRFPLLRSDTVASLLSRTYEHQFDLFRDIIGEIARGETPAPSGEPWGREPLTRAEFDRLGILKADMPDEELGRRTRATLFEQWGPRWASC